MSEQQKMVIGLVGEKGAGKGTFSRLLTEILEPKSVTVVSTKKILEDTLNLWSIKSTRVNLQNLAIMMGKQFGRTALPEAIKGQILQADSDFVVLDCIRWMEDLNLLHSFPQSKLVYITAPLSTRFERLKTRNEKVGENLLTWDQFVTEEHAGTERFIQDIGRRADLKIRNFRTIEEFQQQINRFAERFNLF